MGSGPENVDVYGPVLYIGREQAALQESKHPNSAGSRTMDSSLVIRQSDSSFELAGVKVQLYRGFCAGQEPTPFGHADRSPLQSQQLDSPAVTPRQLSCKMPSSSPFGWQSAICPVP